MICFFTEDNEFFIYVLVIIGIYLAQTCFKISKVYKTKEFDWNELIDGTEQILPENTSTPTTTPILTNITYPDRTEDVEFLYKQTIFDWVFKSWSFVCRNITQALSVVSNKLKETIPSGMTNASGKYDMKVKMTDNDGICYSEKIDLFVEKKP